MGRGTSNLCIACFSPGLRVGRRYCFPPWWSALRTTVLSVPKRSNSLDEWRFTQPVDAPAAQPQPPAAKPQAPAPKPAIRATLHKAPLTVEALCKAHTQRELMVMAGTKSKRSKKQLAERILKTK